MSHRLGLGTALEGFLRTIYSEARLIAGLPALLPILGLPLYAFLSWLIISEYGLPIPTQQIIQAFEIILPLAVGLSVAHLMNIEREEGFDELRFSYPEPTWRLPFQRSLGALCLGALIASAGLAAYRLVAGPFSVWEVLAASLPPALYLLGFSLLVGNLGQSYWAAAAAGMGYWFLELQLRSQLSHPLFLFAYTWPRESLSYSLNREYLVIFGLVFLLTNALVWSLRRSGVYFRRLTLGHG